MCTIIVKSCDHKKTFSLCDARMRHKIHFYTFIVSVKLWEAQRFNIGNERFDKWKYGMKMKSLLKVLFHRLHEAGK